MSAPSFELLRLVALPAGADVAVIELEGRLRPAAQRSGTTPRALKPRLLLEDEAGRMDIPAATHELEGRVLRAAFAVPTARLAGAELAVGVRDVLFDLPAPDTIPGAEREIALAREANALRRELAAARGELAEAEEAREAALAEARREGEERLAAAEVLIARERDEAATREAALTEQLEAEGREAAAREEELRREADAREEAARVEGASAHAAARHEFDARVAALQAELEAARREADAREEHVRQEALAQMEQLRADADARLEQARAGQAAAERGAAERGAAEPATDPGVPGGRAVAEGGPGGQPAAAAQARADQATVELGAVPAPRDVDRGPAGPAAAADPDPPTIRPSTAAGRAEPPRGRGGAGGRAEDAVWQEPAGARAGGLFDEPYDPHPGPATGGAAGGGSVLVDPDDLDDDATAPQPLRRVRRTGEPVPPRGQPATQARPRGPAASRGEEPAVGEASVLRYIALGFVVLALLLVILAIAAL